MFFGDGRKAFLEFLRNLTPQIIFLTLSIIAGLGLDFTKFQFNIDGIKNELPIICCLLIFFDAAIANMSMFIEAAITSNEILDKEIEKIKAKNLKALHLTWALLCAAWAHNRLAFFQIALSLFIVEFAFIAVFIISIQGALASPLVLK